MSDIGELMERLQRAVHRLEVVVANWEEAASADAARMRNMHAEAQALRSLQENVAVRLDAAIARLKGAIGD